MKKSYFATKDDFNFFGNGTLHKMLIDFDCLINGKWKGNDTPLCDDVIEVFNSLRELGYSLFLSEVPKKDEILNWLDETFNYEFICNEYPTRYADTSDYWTEIRRNCQTSLCHEGVKNYNREICFSENWKEILEIVKENDILARTQQASNTYDDIDWNQQIENNGLSDENGNQFNGSNYIPVEKMNQKTTNLLKQIANPETDHPVSYGYKPDNERWPAEIIKWNVKDEIAKNYGVRFVIEQGSLYYRGTWIKITAKAVDGEWQTLQKIVNRFCEDFGFSSRNEISFITPYTLPWTDDQKKREQEDDDTDWYFCSPDDED